MAEGESSYLSMTELVTVIDSQFCAPYPVDLTIVRKVYTVTDAYFAVTDASENILFQIKGKPLRVHERHVLLDSSLNPLVSLQQKILTAHKRWHVFRGDSSEPEDLLFSIKKSSMVQFKRELDLDVFLASNSKEDKCDFKVKGSWFERSCSIYAGESLTIIAQMRKKHGLQSIVLGKDMFSVTIYPNVDQALVVCLVVILDEIHSDDEADEED
ncbi:hypothetical protein LguiA_032029 [Lonicera macranthoides]